MDPIIPAVPTGAGKPGWYIAIPDLEEKLNAKIAEELGLRDNVDDASKGRRMLNRLHLFAEGLGRRVVLATPGLLSNGLSMFDLHAIADGLGRKAIDLENLRDYNRDGLDSRTKVSDTPAGGAVNYNHGPALVPDIPEDPSDATDPAAAGARFGGWLSRLFGCAARR